MNESEVVIGFTKIITDVFEYFNTDWNDSIINLLIGDILDDYGSYSVVEIYKAIHEGRKKQTDLFGKLSGRHFRNWINNYLADMGEDISQFRQNEKFEMQKALENLHIPNAKFKDFGAIPKKSNPDKDEPTNAQKAVVYKQLYNLTPAQKSEREHSHKWKFERDGDYQTYMENFKKSKTEKNEG